MDRGYRLHRNQRVLILSASAGSGHLKAAEALQKACEMNPFIGEIRNVDALNFTNKLFRDFYSKFYLKLVRDAPSLLDWWYESSDEPWKTDQMRFMLDRMNTAPLVAMIRKFDPDICICTHFLPAEIISHLIEKGVVRTRLSIVVTDMDFHSMWLSRVFHHYFVALEETREHLVCLGFPRDCISVSGIPIDPVFAQKKDSAVLRRLHGFDELRPLLVFSAGTFGVGPAEHVVKTFSRLRAPAQIAVICGNNAALESRVRSQVERMKASHLDIRVQGFTREMDEWMTMADVFIGKPGGLTTAEALAKNVPFAIVSPIPGQEERNSDHLLEKGVAIKCNEITTLPYKVDMLLEDPARLKLMRHAARKLARPHSAKMIVQTLLTRLKHEPVVFDEKDREQMVEAARKK